MHEMITSIHTNIYTLLGKQIMLVFEVKKTDEKVVGFLKP